ncbi:hypothetical protein Gorai_014760 [Gossypium raimondii]|uniref:Autophagy-related protein 18a n=1 Tax=Gossypium raimondii TaxID=29730 RepID=A0A7J8P3U9_GOSRA|nr:hypothetical protein [Gossypium raimondii]
MRSVRLRRDRIVVILEHKIFVYNFADLKLLHQIETIANLKGLCVVSQGVKSLVLVCPGLQKGLDGQLLATTSTKGTIIRVYNSADGSLLQEVRRGVDKTKIYRLAFFLNAQWLAVSSDKGTVHVFSLKFNSGSPGSIRSQSDLSRSIHLLLLSEVKCPLLLLDVANSHDSLLSLNYVLYKWKKNIMTIALYLIFLFISEILITYGLRNNITTFS